VEVIVLVVERTRRGLKSCGGEERECVERRGRRRGNREMKNVRSTYLNFKLVFF
jgi:hypothetical protein